MNPQAAGELVHLWVQAHDDPALVSQQSGPVSRAVRALVPDAEHVAVGRTSTGPAMLALAGPALMVVDAQPAGSAYDGPPAVRARLLALDPASADLEVAERFEQRAEGGIVLTRVRRWRLRIRDVDLQLEGSEVVQGAPPGELGRPDANEVLARVIATRLGWRLP
jgi:hypothetical protein